jgi:cell division protein FtsI/penicillin-binding protein 2
MNGKKALLLGGAFALLGVSFSLFLGSRVPHSLPKPSLTKDALSKVLGDSASFYKFPTEVSVPLSSGENVSAVVQYSFDANLQEAMEELMRQYRPDYGAFVAIDAVTGRVLSMVSYTSEPDPERPDNLALRATFPSASVFKVVTAAAAIEEKKFNASTVIPFNGRAHRLYRSLLREKLTRWTRYITLRDAFAQSVNPVFGKIGADEVGSAGLRDYANRFGFNRAIESDLPIQQGRAPIPEDRWGLAETASGFTRDNTMSPMQGALIAAAIVNDGEMMEPYMVQNVYKSDGTPLYTAEPKLSSQTVDKATAEEIRNLMHETVVRGTSRQSFRGFFKGEFRDLKVGGKTGSLTGDNPQGKYDWFAGFADDGFHKIAVCALTVHKQVWRVKSSYLARRAIESYLKGHVVHDHVAVSK